MTQDDRYENMNIDSIADGLMIKFTNKRWIFFSESEIKLILEHLSK